MENNINNYYIVNQSQILIYDHVIDHVEVSETYPSNNHVKISDAQYQFHIDNPTASMQEVWNMELAPPYIQTNADIEQLRQQAYLNESNPIMFAFRQYEMLGETIKADVKKIEWENKVIEIRERYPYIL